MTKPIYLDHAAATPLDPQVLQAMMPYLTEDFYNPSASYLAAKQVATAAAEARRRVAHWFGARPNEIIFTAGGTEANNLAIYGIMSRYPDGQVIISSIEHEAALEPARQFDYLEAPVTTAGFVDLTALEQLITDKTVLVSLMYANNEIGTIQPLRQVSQMLEKVRAERRAAGNERPIYFHTDACQAAGYLDLHASRLGVDMMTINAGKIYGPKQSGALYVRTGIELEPLIRGGGQERGLRSGTENVASMVGLAEALDIAQNTRRDETTRLQTLQKLFLELLAEKVPTAVINGSLKNRLPGNIHLTIPGQDNERLMMALDEAGIICAVGSACSASNEEPSHVLQAIGLSDEAAQSSLRFTMGRSTTDEMVRQTVDKLAQSIATLA